MLMDNIITSDAIAIYIGNSYIKILVGNRKKISQFHSLKIPENSVVDDRIVDLDAVCEALNNFLMEAKIKSKWVSFAIHGQDIVVRHIDIPIMEEKNIRGAIEWELNQYLPNEGKNHYVDFEILDKVVDRENKVYKVLAAAVPREKVDIHLELCKRLNLNLKSIDISANCAARVFKNISTADKSIESIGIIDIGNKNSSIIILDKGKLFMEREVPFGIDNVLREVTKRIDLDTNEAFDFILNDFSFSNINEDNEIENRIKTLFDNVLSSFSKIIQFYTTGKVTKKLDKIFITDIGPKVKGLDEYIEEYFQTSVEIPDSPQKINLKVKLPSDCELTSYINTCGLLLRKE